MKTLIPILLLSFILNSCGHSSNTKTKNSIVSKEKANFIVVSYDYDSLTMPFFFKSLIKNHIEDFVKIDSLEFNKFCSSNKLNQYKEYQFNPAGITQLIQGFDLEHMPDRPEGA